ncbi:MAG TPA: MarR family transcriptional regulator [Gaiellaceae bacterium]|nr:MarR family transcriptional regulator [Gaiellaceae bacterium]
MRLELTAEFRTELRRFMQRTKVVTTQHGLTPERYDLLLMIKAAPEERSTVTELCRSLHLRQTGVTELVKRAEEAGLLRREQSPRDARVSLLALTPEGERRLLETWEALREERRALGAVFEELRRRWRAWTGS